MLKRILACVNLVCEKQQNIIINKKKQKYFSIYFFYSFKNNFNYTIISMKTVCRCKINKTFQF